MTHKYSAADISLVLGVSKRTVQIKAKKEGWPFTLVNANGGKTASYSIEDLPPEIAQKVNKYFAVKVIPQTSAAIKGSAAGRHISEVEQNHKKVQLKVRQDSLKNLAGMQGEKLQRALSKVQIIEAVKEFQARTKLPKIKSVDEFCRLFNENVISLNEEVYSVCKSLSRATYLRWEKTYNTQGVTALAGNYGKAKGSGIIDSNLEIKEFCLALIQEYPHITGQRIHELLQAQFNSKYPIPSASTCRHWLKTWKNENSSLYMSMFDPSAYNNKRMTAFGSMSANIIRINQLWEFDSTPADTMLTDGRFSIVGVLDVFTRRVKLILKPTSNAEGIALLIREALIDWGKPEIARTDNGADYLSAHITTVWNSLDIINDITNPYSGWEKPFIERFFRTFSHGIAELVKGYIGHNVSDREKISARLTFAERLMEKREKGAQKVALDVQLSSTEFQAFIDQWVDSHYHHTEHSELGCTPFEKLTEQKQTISFIEDERILDVLLAPVPSQKGFRTISKEGISVDGGYYIHANLGEYVGERVFCRHNPNDIGKIYVFHALHGHFICEAINPEIADNDITIEHAQEARKLQRSKLAIQRKAFKSLAKTHDVSDAAQKYLDFRTEQTKGLTAFPKPSKDFTNDVISTAQDALKNKPTVPEYSQEQINVFEARRKELEIIEGINTTTSVYKNDHHKARCLTIQKRDASITNLDKAWLHKYRNANPNAAKMLDKSFSAQSTNQK
ncbi:Mu transposase C-terminal domain-containing protein [uncultured Paraglaciecola sp.]|uniref:Mu transposase C-terminal domain-containing protein n=1 Tax=uncultured Paraglaciecola sp. TaxID=1765024 RepID=UPI0026149F2D|nr:Mu transposase C-terminal domain-containing protein [uncultured Paraglaciecola sp.]